LATNCEMESASMPRASAFHPHRASHEFHELLTDRQSESCAAVLACGAGVGLGERLEEAGPGLFIQPDARVAHRKLQLLAVRSDGQHHFALVGELDRVAE